MQKIQYLSHNYISLMVPIFCSEEEENHVAKRNPLKKSTWKYLWQTSVYSRKIIITFRGASIKNKLVQQTVPTCLRSMANEWLLNRIRLLSVDDVVLYWKCVYLAGNSYYRLNIANTNGTIARDATTKMWLTEFLNTWSGCVGLCCVY